MFATEPKKIMIGLIAKRSYNRTKRKKLNYEYYSDKWCYLR